MPLNFPLQTQGRNKGKRASNPQGKSNPPLNVWAANLPRCTTPRCRQPGGRLLRWDRCWTCQRQDTHAERCEDEPFV